MSENESKALDPKLQDALKGIWTSLTDEQKEKAKACKTPDELMKLAAKEGVELPDEMLGHVSSGLGSIILSPVDVVRMGKELC